MTESELEFTKIAALASLELDKNNSQQLATDVHAIMALVEKLRQVDTQNVTPLLHPLDLYQRLREDHVTEDNNVAALAEIAPQFSQDLYLIPKVIGK